MGYFALFYEVVDDFAHRRGPYRDEHLKLARDAHARGELVLAGALAEPADGALLVFRGQQPDPAENFARHDPYVINGLVQRWYVREWSVVVGNEPAASSDANATEVPGETGSGTTT
ncbi:MAG TPA: YciI-like protein [Candidatus Dormibacteraeota bacterium]|nr:YciI-like protein [Candidatus Dormibacteraeota bacterium]